MTPQIHYPADVQLATPARERAAIADAIHSYVTPLTHALLEDIDAWYAAHECALSAVQTISGFPRGDRWE